MLEGVGVPPENHTGSRTLAGLQEARGRVSTGGCWNWFWLQELVSPMPCARLYPVRAPPSGGGPMDSRQSDLIVNAGISGDAEAGRPLARGIVADD